MTHRVQLDFSDAGYEELNKLKERSDAPTYAAVIRNALAIYRWQLDTEAEGTEIIVRDTKKGTTERVRFVRG
jgi:hypothetical protein